MADNLGMPPKRSDLAATEEKRRDLNRRLRLAFLAGAEERSRQTTGRGLTEQELGRVLRRYPGDLPVR